MSSTFILTPVPQWLFTDASGNPLINGQMFTYNSVDKSQFKSVFSDIGGTLPYPNPIIFDSGGMAGPFYWEDDVPYFVQVYDQNGNLRFSIDNYTPPTAGGGTNVTNIIDINNLLINGQLFQSQNVSSVTAGTVYRIAPGASQGFPAIAANGSVIQPYISYSANGSGATKSINSINFALGDDTVESSPLAFTRFQCTGSGTGENFSDFVFPITPGAKSLEGMQLYFSFTGRSSSSSTVSAFFVQSGGFGTNNPATVSTLIDSYVLSANFNKFSSNFAVPSAVGITFGNCGADSVYLVLRMPLNQTSVVDFVNMMLMPTITPLASVIYPYQTADEVGARIFSEQTGDLKFCFYGLSDAITARPGWLPLNDSTIGSVSSGATFSNINTFPLYNLIWNSISNTYAPVSTGRGSSSISDFANNKTLTLMQSISSVMGCANPANVIFPIHALGELSGSDTVTLVKDNIPELSVLTSNGGGGTLQSLLLTDHAVVNNTILVNLQTTNVPVSILQPTTYTNWYIKL